MTACTHPRFTSFGHAMLGVRRVAKQTGRRMRAKQCHCGAWRLVEAKPSPVRGPDKKTPYRNRPRRAA